MTNNSTDKLSLEEMIREMRLCWDSATADKVEAALRAGQELSTLVLQGASIGARGERNLYVAASKFRDAATGEKK